MNVDAYLARIGYQGTRAPAAETLRRLHRAHLLAVPFENLDIAMGRPLAIAPSVLYDKIVWRRRGGFCYELNTLFGWLLEQLGFEVTMLSARVFSDGQPGPAFDHMLLRVAGPVPWIADVGFGDSFIEPLPLDGQTRTQRGWIYRLTEAEGAWTLQRQRPGAAQEPQYIFSLTPRERDEFNPMCHYHQTSPASHFTQKSVCSRLTRAGRVTVSNGRFIITTEGDRQEMIITDEQVYRQRLRKSFGIELDAEAPVYKLLYGEGRMGKGEWGRANGEGRMDILLPYWLLASGYSLLRRKRLQNLPREIPPVEALASEVEAAPDDDEVV